MLFLGIALGSMALMMVQHLSGGAWGVFRRIFEASSRTLPLLAMLFIPVLLGMRTLYPWTHADLVAQRRSAAAQGAVPEHDVLLRPRSGLFRRAGWAVAFLLNRLSRRQDTGDVSCQHDDCSG